MSCSVDVSTLMSRTDTALPNSMTGPHVLPPLFDFVIAPPTLMTSAKSPRPRYSVFGSRPNATDPPPVVGRSSVSAFQVVLFELQLFVRHRPPPDVRKYTTSGLVGWGRMTRARPLSTSWPVKDPF
jgi:hypothetical protein